MSIETLIVTIDRTDGSLVKKMNIRTDAVVGNQCVKNSVWEFCENGKKQFFITLRNAASEKTEISF